MYYIVTETAHKSFNIFLFHISCMTRCSPRYMGGISKRRRLWIERPLSTVSKWLLSWFYIFRKRSVIKESSCFRQNFTLRAGLIFLVQARAGAHGNFLLEVCDAISFAARNIALWMPLRSDQCPSTLHRSRLNHLLTTWEIDINANRSAAMRRQINAPKNIRVRCMFQVDSDWKRVAPQEMVKPFRPCLAAGPRLALSWGQKGDRKYWHVWSTRPLFGGVTLWVPWRVRRYVRNARTLLAPMNLPAVCPS